jgi:DNA-binding transcriptional regulator YiaG
LRQRAGLSHSALARQADIPIGTLRSWETARQRARSRLSTESEDLMALARASGYAVQALVATCRFSGRIVSPLCGQ